MIQFGAQVGLPAPRGGENELQWVTRRRKLSPRRDAGPLGPLPKWSMVARK